MESACHSVYHHIGEKHWNSYVTQFLGKINLWNLDTEIQMQRVVAAGVVGRRLLYREMIA